MQPLAQQSPGAALPTDQAAVPHTCKQWCGIRITPQWVRARWQDKLKGVHGGHRYVAA